MQQQVGRLDERRRRLGAKQRLHRREAAADGGGAGGDQRRATLDGFEPGGGVQGPWQAHERINLSLGVKEEGAVGVGGGGEAAWALNLGRR